MAPDALSGPGLHRQFTGHLTVGVPGTVAGMASALARYGTISLRAALAPAERLARRGVVVPASLSRSMEENASRLSAFPAARAQFLAGGTRPYAAGETLVQRELAATLRRIQRGGARAFYRGHIARLIVRDMRVARPDTQDAGLMTLADLAAYRVRWRAPIRATYRDHALLLVPAPSSGGIAIAEMLNILSAFDLRAAGQSSADALHLLAEAQKIAFADRGAYVADPAFVRVPTGELTSRTYAGARSREIDLARAQTYRPGLETTAQARAADTTENPNGSTTHVSVIDRRGNAVAVTCTIEQEFGSAVVAPGTGFLLNNELTDFGAPGTANQPAPGKRPRSSMSPSIVVGPSGRPVLVTGGAGGSRIIMGTLLSILNRIDYGLTVADAVDAERIDASTGRLEIEDGRVAAEVLAGLLARGHELVPLGEYAVRPRINAAGEDPVQPGLPPNTTLGRVAVSDPRTDQGSVAVRRIR